MPVPERPFDAEMVRDLEDAFGREHERTYGHRAGAEEPVELVSIQVVAQGVRARPAVPPSQGIVSRRRAQRPARRAGPISDRRTAGSRPRSCPDRPWHARKRGPLILEEYDATCVVPPGATARLDAGGNIRIEL